MKQKQSTYGTGVITKERSGRYRVRIPDGKGKYRSLGTRATEEEAERLRAAGLDEAGSLCLSGESLFAYGERVIERWARAGQASVRSDRARWATIIARAPFARAALDVVTRADVRNFARKLPSLQATRSTVVGGKRERVELDRTLSWQSCKHALGLLGRVFEEAVSDGLIAQNPAKGARLPRRQDRTEGWTYLTISEIERVFALDLSAEQRTVLTLAIFQGLRLGEIAGLTWDAVDLAGGWLVVAASWAKATKSGRVRRIPLLAPARAALEAWRPDKQTRRGLLLPSAEGGCYSVGYDWGWGDRRNRLDIPRRASIGRRVRFHDLRHTCAAHLISGSWGRAWRLAEVRAFLGHTEESVTARYAHLAPDALHATAQLTASAAATPDANLSQELLESVVSAARLLNEINGAGGGGFEPTTFGSGGPGSARDLGSLPRDAAGLRQVLLGLLDATERGESIGGDQLAAAGLAALRLDLPARYPLALLGAIGTPRAFRTLIGLSDRVGEIVRRAEAKKGSRP